MASARRKTYRLKRAGFQAAPPDAVRKRILVADDNADMLGYGADYDVAATSNGADALRIALERVPDLILSDS